MSEWQSVYNLEEVPKGKLLLVWQDLSGVVLRKYMEGEWWDEYDNLDDSGLEVSHWMPTPEPPEDNDE